MIQRIFENINKRLENDGISSYSYANEIIFEIRARFDLTKAKFQYLRRKEEKLAIEKERKEAGDRIKEMDKQIYE